MVGSDLYKDNAAPIEETHDTHYLKYIQKTYGTTSIPFFGAIMCVIILLLTTVILMFNIALESSNEEAKNISKKKITQLFEVMKNMSPVIYYEDMAT